jgi:hypothetical protein
VGTQQIGKGEGILKGLDGAGKADLFSVERVFELFEKESAKQLREHCHGEKESGQAGYPAFVIRRKTAAGNYASRTARCFRCGREYQIARRMITTGTERLPCLPPSTS